MERLFIIAFLISLPVTALCQTETNLLLKGKTQPVPVLVIAHRGARAYAPENTIEAFEKGMAMGAHMFELDVQLTKDGHLIIVHDNDLVRCSDVQKKFPDRKNYYVTYYTLEEIRSLDAGSWYVEQIEKPAQDRQKFLQSLTEEEKKAFIAPEDILHYKSGNVKLPTLKEALALAKKHKSFVNIEIKNIPRFFPEIAEKTVKLVEEMEIENLVIISSFDHCVIKRCKELNPRIATAFLCSDRIYDPGRYGKDILDADAYNPGCYGEDDTIGFYSVAFETTGKLPTESIQSARSAGLGVNTWTVNDPSQMKILVESGVTGIFTDYPNRLINVLKK